MSPSSDSYIEDDKVLSATDRHLMFRLLGFVLPYWRLIVVSSLLSLSMALLQLAGPWIVKLAIDDHIAIGDYAGVARLSVWFAATVVAMFGFEYVQGFLVTWVGQKGMFDLRAKLFGHLQDLPVAFFDRTPVGRIMTRLTGDVQSLNELFAQGVMTLAGDVFLLLAIVALMLWTDAKLACIVFVTIPILVAVGQIYRVKAREAFRDVRTRLSLLNTYLQENISGIRTVQAYNREALNFQRFSELNDSHREANLRSVFYLAVFFPAVEFVAALGLALIIWYGGGQAVSGAITLGTLVLFIQYTQRLFQPIRDLTEKFNIFQAAVAAAERIFKLLDTPATVVSPPEPVPVKTVGREIAFENVWFAYKGEDWVLRDVNLTVRKGETVALVGSTGSGKTTITNLLGRFYDVQRGRITIDGTDIRQFDLGDLRRLMAVVLQDAFLFTGDIAGNIRLGNDDISLYEIREVARVVNAAPFIEALPGGYDNEVRERGATLSVGQKQLLAFARALAFDPQILILDEATASIDTETERLIQDALGKMLRGRTAIVIAHRLSTIQKADKIVVLHHGKVREVGTHAELLQLDGFYRKLYELQYRDSRSDEDEASMAAAK